MKKIMFGLFAAILLLSASIVVAYPSATGTISDTPQAGVWKTHLSANDTKGALCQIGGNTFMLVNNASGVPCFQGEPAFWDLTAARADAYSVTTYESTSNYDTFAGVWYCDVYGSTAISTVETGWIQVKGVGNLYASGEGTNIAVGDILAGCLTPTLTASDTATRAYVKRDHAIRTSSTGTSSYEIDVLRYPKAMKALTDAAGKGMIPVMLGY